MPLAAPERPGPAEDVEPLALPAPEVSLRPAPEPADIREVEAATAGFAGPLLARLLAQRGLRDADRTRSFLAPRTSDLCDPRTMLGMDRVVARLKRAVEGREAVLVYGDYDVDGVSSVALVTRVLRDLGVRVQPFAPPRSDGYGLRLERLEDFYRRGCRLAISCDSGSSAGPALEAMEGRLEVLVTDHHIPDGSVDYERFAMVNPVREECGYAHKSLCGAGVAYKTMEALLLALRADPRRFLLPHVYLAAIGTICDVMRLDTPENRWLVRRGIDAVRAGYAGPGVQRMFAEIGCEMAALSERTIGWDVGPWLNGAGRVGDPMDAARLLLVRDHEKAATLAEVVKGRRAEVKQLTDRVFREAVKRVLEEGAGSERASYVLGSAEWPAPVVGIAAGRLAHALGRPVILFGREGEHWVGSGRAGESGVHLRDLLARCAVHLAKFGGHPAAAGMTLAGPGAEAVASFAAAFEAEARQVLPPGGRGAVLHVDLAVRLTELTKPVFDDQYSRLAPFGKENAEPVFLAEDVRLASARVVGRGTLKVTLEQGRATLPGIAFQLAQRRPELAEGSRCDALFTWSENWWTPRNSSVPRRELQARILDLVPRA